MPKQQMQFDARRRSAKCPRIDADVRFAALLDHPAVEHYLVAFLGEDYRHIDNEMYFTYPSYEGGHWHRGVQAHPSGHVVNGQFICPIDNIHNSSSSSATGWAALSVLSQCTGLHSIA